MIENERLRIHNSLAVGDIVTRDGTDRQKVVSLDGDGWAGIFRCTRPSVNGWCEVGDEEYNVCSRYHRVPD